MTARDPSGLFVYGTLLTGYSHEGLLAGLEHVQARVRGALWDLPAGYPALVPDEGGGWVHGELVRLRDPRVLSLLDHYEGVDEGLFRRVVVPVFLGLRTVSGWTFVMDHPDRRGGAAVPSGRWRAVRRR